MIKLAQLNWKTLDYWRSKGIDFTHTYPVIVISENEEGDISGLLAFGAAPAARAIVISPLIADNGVIALALMTKAEELLSDNGIFRYAFYLNEQTSEAWRGQVTEMADLGIFQFLGTSEVGAEWYERNMLPIEQMSMH